MVYFIDNNQIPSIPSEIGALVKMTILSLRKYHAIIILLADSILLMKKKNFVISILYISFIMILILFCLVMVFSIDNNLIASIPSEIGMLVNMTALGLSE